MYANVDVGGGFFTGEKMLNVIKNIMKRRNNIKQSIYKGVIVAYLEFIKDVGRVSYLPKGFSDEANAIFNSVKNIMKSERKWDERKVAKLISVSSLLIGLLYAKYVLYAQGQIVSAYTIKNLVDALLDKYDE